MKHKLVGHVDKIYSLAFDGNVIVSGSLDRTIRIWNPNTGQCIRVLEGSFFSFSLSFTFFLTLFFFFPSKIRT